MRERSFRQTSPLYGFAALPAFRRVAAKTIYRLRRFTQTKKQNGLATKRQRKNKKNDERDPDPRTDELKGFVRRAISPCRTEVCRLHRAFFVPQGRDV